MRTLTAALSLAVFALISPVCVLRGTLRSGEVIVSMPMPFGAAFTTRYIHSVARTPVEDEYRILPNALWGWEERTRSHGAGLPFEAPRSGTFAEERGAMVFRGGRAVHKAINMRVGSRELGANVISADVLGTAELFVRFRGQLVTLSPSVEPLFSACVIWPSAE